MKKHLTLIVLFTLSALPAMAQCICDDLYVLDSVFQRKYNFIATVTITDDGDLAKSKITRFSIKELFKGDASINTVLESSKYTECDLGISNGTEWLIFGVLVDGKLTLQRCDRNFRRPNAKETERDFKIWDNNLERLRKLFNKPLHTFYDYADGQRITYFQNGQKEVEEYYQHNRRHGDRKTWYPNGQLQSTEYFVHGAREKEAKWYYSTGQIQEERYFRNDKECGISRTFIDSSLLPNSKKRLLLQYKTVDSLPVAYRSVQVSCEKVYNMDGALMLTRCYNMHGKRYEEYIGEKGSGQGVLIRYRTDGSIHSSINYYDERTVGVTKVYDKDGSLIYTQ